MVYELKQVIRVFIFKLACEFSAIKDRLLYQKMLDYSKDFDTTNVIVTLFIQIKTGFQIKQTTDEEISHFFPFTIFLYNYV